MDDPFIKADTDRVRTQLKAIKGIVDLGWQVLYFTAKKEIEEALATEIGSGSVNLIKLDPIFD